MEHCVHCPELPFEEAVCAGIELERTHKLLSHEQIFVTTPSLNLSMTYQVFVIIYNSCGFTDMCIVHCLSLKIFLMQFSRFKEGNALAWTCSMFSFNLQTFINYLTVCLS